jgi:dethiobiotin synthetase
LLFKNSGSVYNKDMKQKKLFIASTGKDVGKTTLSLGIIDFLNKKNGPCGFMKPIGQDQLLSHGVSMDKDAVLIKNYFNLKETEALSPVSIPQGFTKDYLDQKVCLDSLIQKIKSSASNMNHYPSMVYEGTGHLGVGSIIDLNNAQVAKLLKTPLLLVTKGGIGSSFDELMLNLALCEKYNLEVLGVVLNKVIPEKKEMITEYFQKALIKHSVPFLGALPYDMLLAKPSFNDLKLVLDTNMIMGEPMGLKHVEGMHIVASNSQIPELKPYDLLIVSASREGLIHSLLYQALEMKIPLGFILTQDEPSTWLLKELQKSPHFVLTTKKTSEDVLIELSNYHAKIQSHDGEKIAEAIQLVQKHVHLDKLFEKSH